MPQPIWEYTKSNQSLLAHSFRPTHQHSNKLEEVDIFFERLYDHSISMDSEDSVEWLNTKSGIFFVRSFYSSLASRGVDLFPHSIVWNSWALVRVSFVAGEATWATIDSRSAQKEEVEDA